MSFFSSALRLGYDLAYFSFQLAKILADCWSRFHSYESPPYDRTRSRSRSGDEESERQFGFIFHDDLRALDYLCKKKTNYTIAAKATKATERTRRDLFILESR